MRAARLAGCSAVVVLALTLAPAAACAQDDDEVPPPMKVRAVRPLPYRVAFGTSLSAGRTGWVNPPAAMAELGGRVQVAPSFSLGLSYLHLATAKYDGDGPIKFDALEIAGAFHPLPGATLDPFVQAGVLGLFNVDGPGLSGPAPRLALEAMAGLDVVHLPFAVGLHARAGFANHGWALGGLHVELRL